MRIFKNGDKPLKKNDKFLKYYREIDDSSNRLQKIINDTKTCSYFFNGNFSKKDIKFYIDSLDFSNVTNMKYMFYKCYNLQTIPQLNTGNVTNIQYMFSNCYNLQTIDITSMDKIANTGNSYYMCEYCYSLKKLIIRNMTKIPPLSSNSFNSCSHFNGTVHSTYNPYGLKDARIYVPDNMVETLKSATNWSAYADIIVPLSSLEE